MEIILNFAWALCSLGLILLWIKSPTARTVPRTLQILALAMVVVLLLPVISLSDDLMAMQSPAETDTSCLRRALHPSDFHPSVVPSAWATPVPVFTEMLLDGFSRELLESYHLTPLTTLLPRSLDSRPPPQA